MRETIHTRALPEQGLVCAIWRRVEGTEPLLALVPASTYACLNLIVSGSVRPTSASAPFPPAFLTGPFCTPIVTETQGPLLSLSLVLPAWRLPAWFGVAPAQAAGRALPLAAARCAPLLAAVHDPQQLEAAWAAFCADAPAADAQGAAAAAALAATLVGQGSVAAAARALRLSERQFERRFLAGHGLTPKAWLQVRRFELALAALPAPQALTAQAQDAGYADQSHMARQFRRAAGMTPGLARLSMTAPAAGHWAFRAVRSAVSDLFYPARD